MKYYTVTKSNSKVIRHLCQIHGYVNSRSPSKKYKSGSNDLSCISSVNSNQLKVSESQNQIDFDIISSTIGFTSHDCIMPDNSKNKLASKNCDNAFTADVVILQYPSNKEIDSDRLERVLSLQCLLKLESLDSIDSLQSQLLYEMMINLYLRSKPSIMRDLYPAVSNVVNTANSKHFFDSKRYIEVLQMFSIEIKRFIRYQLRSALLLWSSSVQSRKSSENLSSEIAFNQNNSAVSSPSRLFRVHLTIYPVSLSSFSSGSILNQSYSSSQSQNVFLVCFNMSYRDGLGLVHAYMLAVRIFGDPSYQDSTSKYNSNNENKIREQIEWILDVLNDYKVSVKDCCLHSKHDILHCDTGGNSNDVYSFFNQALCRVFSSRSFNDELTEAIISTDISNKLPQSLSYAKIFDVLTLLNPFARTNHIVSQSLATTWNLVQGLLHQSNSLYDERIDNLESYSRTNETILLCCDLASDTVTLCNGDYQHLNKRTKFVSSNQVTHPLIPHSGREIENDLIFNSLLSNHMTHTHQLRTVDEHEINSEIEIFTDRYAIKCDNPTCDSAASLDSRVELSDSSNNKDIVMSMIEWWNSPSIKVTFPNLHRLVMTLLAYTTSGILFGIIIYNLLNAILILFTLSGDLKAMMPGINYTDKRAAVRAVDQFTESDIEHHELTLFLYFNTDLLLLSSQHLPNEDKSDNIFGYCVSFLDYCINLVENR